MCFEVNYENTQDIVVEQQSGFYRYHLAKSKYHQSGESGRPEEFHLQSPSEPYVNLSIHTARASHELETSRSQADTDMIQLLPIIGLAVYDCELTHPLRSSSITEPSTLLRDDPPPSCASILSPFVDLTYRVFS